MAIMTKHNSHIGSILSINTIVPNRANSAINPCISYPCATGTGVGSPSGWHTALINPPC